MGDLSGLKVPGSSHIHQPRLQMGLFLVEESWLVGWLVGKLHSS